MKDVLLFCVLLGLSCVPIDDGGEDRTIVVDTSRIFPMADGVFLKYHRTLFDSLGVVFHEDTLVLTMSRSSDTGDLEWFQFIRSDGFSYGDYGLGADGVWRKLPGIDQHLLYKYPVSENETYIMNYGSESDITEIQVTCIDADTIITTPMGPVSCYRYIWNEGPFSMEAFLSLGVGLVKEVALFGNENSKRELIAKNF